MNTNRNAAENNIGRLLSGKYRLLRVLGEGGMGAVYEAEHTLIGRRFAVKVMHSLFTSMPDSVERFLREARAAGSIGHPNIIEVQDVGEPTVQQMGQTVRGCCTRTCAPRRVHG